MAQQETYLALFRRWFGIAAVVYTFVFVIDCFIHAGEGWTQGAEERDRILMAKHDCRTENIHSDILRNSCAQLLATPVPVPWQRAVHHAARHLSEKMASTLQCLIILLLLFFVMFIWVGRYQYHDLQLVMRRWLGSEGDDAMVSEYNTHRTTHKTRPATTVIQLPENILNRRAQKSNDRDNVCI